jgi:hypothetical protein
MYLLAGEISPSAEGGEADPPEMGSLMINSFLTSGEVMRIQNPLKKVISYQ